MLSNKTNFEYPLVITYGTGGSGNRCFYEIADSGVVLLSLHFPSMKPVLTFCAAFLNS